MTKIVIIGGGASGLITAALMENYWQDRVNITLYYDSNNKNIAVGEGTTPSFVSGICERIGYTKQQAIKELDATLKLGINFKDWIVGEEYFHGFSQLSRHEEFDDNLASVYGFLNDCYDGGQHFSQASTLIPENVFTDSEFAFHIDTEKLSDFLFKYLQDKIEIVDDVVEKVYSDGNNIQGIDCRTNGYVEADLWVDASGFNAILFKELNSEWIDASNTLPINRAIPQQVPNNSGEIPSHTIAEATKNGWIWTIPTQDRLGTGYLYSSKFTTDENARYDYNNWLLKNHGVELSTDRVISWNTGHYKDVWIGNCFAVGISAGFTEPLEALGHHYIVFMVNSFISLNSSLKMLQYNRNRVNQASRHMWDDSINFLSMHYNTMRTDSPFWKHMTENRTEWVKTFDERCRKEFIDLFLNDDMLDFWAQDSYIQIMNGLNLFDKESIKSYVDSREDSEDIYYKSMEQHYKFKELKDNTNMISHKKYLETLKELSTLPYLI